MPTHPRAVAPRGRIAFVAAIVAALIASVFSITIQASPVSAAPVDAGYKDHSYGPGGSDPTEDKPQSKVWFADGSWWGGLFNGPDAEYHIYRYNAAAHTWSDTNVVVDVRNSSHGDYLWDGSSGSLYVASVNGDTDADPILVFKYDYNATTDTYTLDPDFVSDHDGDLDTEPGLVVGQGPAETVTIAKDSTGQLWVTYDNPVDVNNRNIMVNRSTTNEHTWGTPFDIGVAGPDDISAIVAFNGNVGVMWSEHRVGDLTSSFHFRVHPDGAADTAFDPAVSVDGGAEFAEDHINLKLTTTASGQVLAAVKTNGGPNHIQVLRRQSNGTFTQHVVVGASQPATRPQLVVDETNDEVYVFYTSPESDGAGDQAIYYKKAPLSTLNFGGGGGLGTLFIKDGAQDINNVSTAKHNVTAPMGGILAIASADSNDSHYHGWIAISGGTTPTPTPTPTPPPSGGSGFTDIANSPFKNDIEWAYAEGITGGCATNPPRYCPNNVVTRQQMASFLVRALDLPPTSTDYFGDDNSSIHENDINALAASGITGGCAANRFCPTATVTREQMASFLVRGYKLASSSTNYFSDDNSSIHENDINALRASGITGGCTATTYCPKSGVTRGQMAAFLRRAETR